MNFFRFFSNLRIFFCVLKKRLSHEILICFRKRTKPYTQEVSGQSVDPIRKYDSNIFRSTGFLKIRKNLYVFDQIDKSIFAKKNLRCRFFC